jgi:hypothetical protein
MSFQPIQDHPQADSKEVKKPSRAICGDLLYQISPKLNSTCGMCRHKFIYVPKGSMIFTAPVFMNTNIIKSIAVHIICTKLYPKSKKKCTKWQKLMPYTKYAFHCTDFHELYNCSTALYGEQVHQTLPRLVKKYSTAACSSKSFTPRSKVQPT